MHKTPFPGFFIRFHPCNVIKWIFSIPYCIEFYSISISNIKIFWFKRKNILCWTFNFFEQFVHYPYIFLRHSITVKIRICWIFNKIIQWIDTSTISYDSIIHISNVIIIRWTVNTINWWPYRGQILISGSIKYLSYPTLFFHHSIFD